MIRLFLLLVFVVTTVCHAEDFSSSRKWLSLLYYEKGFTGYKSLADGPDFFITPDGKTNPKGEYQASLSLVQAQDISFRTKFPLRYKWISQQNQLPYHPLVTVNPDITSATIAFPNRFMSNPSSMFGHLILIFKSKNGLMDSDILHYIADTARTSPKLYVAYGMSGGFKGYFFQEPYFKKIKDYTYVEDREIIYYDLNLSPDQIENLQLHAVELKQTYFNYYFLDENCAFFIGKTLNIILDQDVIKKPWVTVPSEVVGALIENDYLRNDYHRGSSTALFNERYQALTPRQRKVVLTLLTQEVDNCPTDIAVLETFLLISEHIMNNSTDLTQIIRYNRIKAYDLLKKQNHTPIRPALVYKEKVTRIKSKGLHAGYGFRDQTFLSYRPIYYGDGESLNRMDVKKLMAVAPRVIASSREPVQVDLTLAEIISIAPYTSILQTKSWKINSMIGVKNDFFMHHSLDFGRAYSLSKHTMVTMFGGGTFASYNPFIEEKSGPVKLLPGVSVGISHALTKRLKGDLSYDHRYGDDFIRATVSGMGFSLFHEMGYVQSRGFEGVRFSSTFIF